MSGYLRLDTLKPVSGPVLWGASLKAVTINRYALFKEPAPGRVPYLPISSNRAVRLVPASEERIARLAFLLARDGDRCLYCGDPLDFDSCQIEHVLPRAAGEGAEDVRNLALTCAPCNRAAHDLSVVQKVALAVKVRVGTGVGR